MPADTLDCQNGELKENGIYSQLLRCLDEPIEVKIELSTDEEIQEDLYSDFRVPSFETTTISEIPSACELEQELVNTPGEGKQPISVLNDRFCEELAHPHLFPTGKYGYQIEREIPSSPSKYLNQRLLHYT